MSRRKTAGSGGAGIPPTGTGAEPAGSSDGRHGRPRRTRVRRYVVLLVVIVLVAGVVAAAILGWTLIGRHRAVADRCQVVGQSTGAVYAMDPEQLLNASTIADLAMRRGLPQQAVIVALATVLQESKLRNLNYGDRDSVGLFQQRESQGWGARQDLLNPVYASGKFYDALVKVPNWQNLPVAVAAQAVQRSGFPDAYAQWQQRATAMAAALTGTTSGQLSCRIVHPGVDPRAGVDATGSVGGSSATSSPATSLQPSATPLGNAVSTLTNALATDLHITSPAVVATGTKSMTITISGLSEAGSSGDPAAEHRAPTVAAWALAHARSGITSVVIGDQEWQPKRAGWATSRAIAAPGTVVMTVSLR